MWFWLVSLVTVALSPAWLLLGRPTHRSPVSARTLTRGHEVARVSSARLEAEFPWSSRSWTLTYRAWPWTRWVLERMRIVAFTAFGLIVERSEMSTRTRYHEAIHVIDQATHPLGPVGVAVGYVFDLITWWSWRKISPYRRTRAPLAEHWAYYCDGRDPRD